MKTALVLSRCECQATLGAVLDENRVVLHGFARDPRRQRELPAPANTMGNQGERFDVGWACPLCTRNVLRSFDASGLVFRETTADGAASPASTPA